MLSAVLKCSESTLSKEDSQCRNGINTEKFSILEILYGYKQILRLLETGRKQARSVSAVIELAGKTSIVCEGKKTTVKNTEIQQMAFVVTVSLCLKLLFACII